MSRYFPSDISDRADPVPGPNSIMASSRPGQIRSHRSDGMENCGRGRVWLLRDMIRYINTNFEQRNPVIWLAGQGPVLVFYWGLCHISPGCVVNWAIIKSSRAPRHNLGSSASNVEMFGSHVASVAGNWMANRVTHCELEQYMFVQSALSR
jgi:hypothetical protein